MLEFESEGLEHFVCSCHCICIGLSPPRGFVVVLLVSLLLLGLWTLDAFCGRPFLAKTFCGQDLLLGSHRRYLSNKIGLTSFGVHLQKL